MTLRERMGETGGAAPAGGASDLVHVLDSLAARRPAGDPWLPVVVLRGAGAGPFLDRYRRRLVADGGGAIVPHVRLDGARLAAADDPDLLDALAQGLEQGMPPGTGRLRLPAYRMVRAVLHAEVARGDERDRRRDLVAHLYASRGRWRGAVGRLDPDPPGGPAEGPWHLLAVVVGPAVRGLAHGSLAWRLARSRRFRWLGGQLPPLTGQRGDFLAAALHLVDERAEARDGRPDPATDELVRRVLVLALLHDLDGATRRSLVSPARRRRIGAFTVLVDGVAPGTAARRLLDTVGDLDPREVPRRGTTLVVVALAPPDPPPKVATATGAGTAEAHGVGRARWRRRTRPPRYGPAEPAASRAEDDGFGPGLPPDEAAERLAAAHGRRSGPPTRRLVVDVPDEPDPARRSASDRKVAAHRPAGAVAVPVATGVVATLLAASLAWAAARALEPDPGCPGVEPSETGEPVGLGDGTARCSFFAALPGSAGEDRRAVEAEIARENAEVLAAAEQGQPYRTIVFFAPLTLPDQPEREGQDALPQLRGIATAQRWANEAARSDVNRVRARVLLANPGDRFRHGPAVARRIVAEAGRRDDLVGVVGIAQSRRESREAVRILGQAGLPVVAGPVTGDAMIDSSPHYYQVSPRNARVASVLAEFARRAPLVRSGADGTGGTARGTPADRAVIVEDHSDEYSQNLADDFHERFTEAGGEVVRTISYPVAEPELPAEPRSGVPAADRVGSLDQLAERLCGALEGEREVVFFAARSQQLQGMLNSVRSRPGCGARPLTVVAGTDTTKFVEAASAGAPGRLDGVDLYYGAFAAPGVEPTEAADTFLARYVDAYGRGSIRVDMSDPALVYDAFTALQLAVNHTRRSDLDMTASDVAGALSGNEVRFDGATGYVALDDAQPISRVPPDKPVLVLRATDGLSEVRLACGRFTEGDTAHRVWGPARTPCPVED